MKKKEPARRSVSLNCFLTVRGGGRKKTIGARLHLSVLTFRRVKAQNTMRSISTRRSFRKSAPRNRERVGQDSIGHQFFSLSTQPSGHATSTTGKKKGQLSLSLSLSLRTLRICSRACSRTCCSTPRPRPWWFARSWCRRGSGRCGGGGGVFFFQSRSSSE